MSAIEESASAVSPSIVGDGVADLIATLGRATPQQIAAIRVHLGMEAVSVAATVKAEKAPKPVKLAVPKTAKPAAALPAGEGIPTAADYRVASVTEGVCVSRRLRGGEDRRWKPIVYRETQCGAPVVEGSDICTKCAAKEAKFADDPSPKCDWIGRVTEEPPGWCRMLGTAWALGKPPVFLGAAAPEGAAEAVEAVSSSSSSSAPPAPTTKKAAKEKEAAEKKAAKEKEKAAKEKEKEDKKAAKAAKPKAAPKAKPAPKAAGGAGGPPPPPAAATEEEEAEDVEGSIRLIDGIMYSIKDGNVYEYDELSEKVGDFVGRLKADGDSIDTDAEEKGAAEEED